jgi:hypothetical protein
VRLAADRGGAPEMRWDWEMGGDGRRWDECGAEEEGGVRGSVCVTSRATGLVVVEGGTRWEMAAAAAAADG